MAKDSCNLLPKTMIMKAEKETFFAFLVFLQRLSRDSIPDFMYSHPSSKYFVFFFYVRICLPQKTIVSNSIVNMRIGKRLIRS